MVFTTARRARRVSEEAAVPNKRPGVTTAQKKAAGRKGGKATAAKS
jgi:hypothetical protein